MKIIHLQFDAPLQSWGDSSTFTTRRTRPFPTKSGIVGLLASAMGITREEPEKLSHSGLCKIDPIIRIDKEGKNLNDYQIVRDSTINKINKISKRDYITDAAFTIGIIHENELVLNNIVEALQHPKNALYLGRKSCPPARPIFKTVDDYLDIYDFFTKAEYIGDEHKDKKTLTLQTLYTSADGSLALMDNPIDFSKANRQYTTRTVKREYITIENPYYISTNFDSMEVGE